MSSISIGVRDHLYPDWVEELYKDLPEEAKSRLVKYLVYAFLKPETRNRMMGEKPCKYEFEQTLIDNSNRWGGASVEDVAFALLTMISWYTYNRAIDLGDPHRFADEVETALVAKEKQL
jgi:hypothetical protein